MSVSADMELRLNSTNCPTALDIIKALLSFGWCFDDYGKSSFLPIGDIDYEWQSLEIPDDDLLKIIFEKEKNEEIIGVVMTWKFSKIGGDFLFHKDGLISISLSINRETTLTNFTDVTWYIDRIIPALQKHGIIIESLTFSEHV